MYTRPTSSSACKTRTSSYLHALAAGLRAAWRALSNSTYKTVK
jgi:hypothetical protein